MSHRYVILHHTGVVPPHFDVMIETAPGGPLMTWRSLDWPIVRETNLTKLDEHRPAYLEFEGPVSGDRGQVKRIASGECEPHWLSPHELKVTLAGTSLLIQRLDDDHWLVTP